MRLLDAHHHVLVRAVADPERHLDPPAADEVEHGEVLGQPERIVEDGDQRREVDAHPLRTGRDRRRLHDRRRAVAVVGPVVLGQVDRFEAEAVTPLAHVHRRRVQHGRARPRCPGRACRNGGPGACQAVARSTAAIVQLKTRSALPWVIASISSGVQPASSNTSCADSWLSGHTVSVCG